MELETPKMLGYFMQSLQAYGRLVPAGTSEGSRHLSCCPGELHASSWDAPRPQSARNSQIHHCPYIAYLYHPNSEAGQCGSPFSIPMLDVPVPSLTQAVPGYPAAHLPVPFTHHLLWPCILAPPPLPVPGTDPTCLTARLW